MKTHVFFISICVGFSLGDETINGDVTETFRKSNSEIYIDVLTEQLTAHTWSADEELCLEEILKTSINIKNNTLWATWIWDSIQLPVGQLYGSKYHLGNYDQCLRETVGSSQMPFRTHYCVANIVFGCDEQAKLSSVNSDASTEEYVCTKTKMKQSLNVMTWGVCLPQSCQTESVKTFLRVLLKQSHLGHLQSPVNITVTHCEPAGETKRHIDGFHIVLIAALSMVAFVMFCTKYVSGRGVDTNTFMFVAMKCFCLRRNTKEWLQRPRNDVQVLHGIRFFSTCLILFVHIFFIPLTTAMANGLDFEETFFGYVPVIKILLMVVDTFFVMSGLLHAKNTKPNSTVWEFVHLLIKRYFRLMWWYIATAVVTLVILPRTGCGPLAARIMNIEYEHCRQSWLPGLLMIENYIPYIKGCNPVAWYIFCDFHLTVVGSILLWLHQRNARAAAVCFSALAALSILLPASVVYNMPELINLQIDFETYNIFRIKEKTPAVNIYINTHHRASSYLVGLAMGYLMSYNKLEILRRIITKKQFVMSFLSVLSLGIIMIVNLNENLKAAVLLIAMRLGWACMICALIAACEWGSLPYVEDLLSSSIFVPLSKLTYGIYFIHPITIAYTWYSPRSLPHFNGYIVTEKYLGNLTLSCFLSLLFLLFVEAPLNNFIKLLCNFSTKQKLNKPDRVNTKSNGEVKSRTRGELLPDKPTETLSDYKQKML